MDDQLSTQIQPTDATRTARSVAELLPRPFDELGLADIREILARVGEDGESLYFERKRTLHGPSLAKGCAAFANTYGGLLMVGVDDDSDELVGIEPIGEAQVRVKDILRGRLQPMPSFRARFVPVSESPDSPGILLVLVEESTATPHLLTRSGAIYTRNPGSSDPAPVGDQSFLLELTRRGREARTEAMRRAVDLGAEQWNEFELHTLVLAPTGCSTDPVADLYRAADTSILAEATELWEMPDWILRPSGTRSFVLPPEWSLHDVRLRRHFDLRFGHHLPEHFLDGVVLTSDGVVQLQRCLVSDRGENPEPRGPESLHMDDPQCGLIPWFKEAMRRGQELILAVGGHGDLYVHFRIAARGRHVFWAQHRAEVAKDEITLAFWTALDADPETLSERVIDGIRRSLAVPPDW
jgi:hypothetical protein